MATINRDPFARASLARRVAFRKGEPGGSCRWCGRKSKHRDPMLTSIDKALYEYGWEPDGLRSRVDWRGPFCDVSCYRAFAG